MRKLLITEEEKSHIKKLHNINEQSFIEKALALSIKKMFEKPSKTPSSSEEKPSETGTTKSSPVNGDVKIVGNFDSEQQKNINFLFENFVNLTFTY